MEFDELRSTWKTIKSFTKTDEEIREMLKENKHPVLSGIRKQIIIETTCWFAFLVSYYSMFDGADKPPIINAVLIIAVTILLLHNLYGYNFAKYLDDTVTIKDSLKLYLRRMKIYAVFSIATRMIFTCGVILFFSYNIHSNGTKYIFLAVVILLLIFAQGFFLIKIWKKRIEELSKTLDGFS